MNNSSLCGGPDTLLDLLSTGGTTPLKSDFERTVRNWIQSDWVLDVFSDTELLDENGHT